MIIVFEGPDGSGKSYNSKRIANRFGWEWIESRRPESKQDIQNHLMDFEMYAESNKIYVTDRAPFISEFIYSVVFENDLLIEPEKLTKLWAQTSLVVYCRPNKPSVETISREYKKHKPQEFTSQILRRFNKVVDMYDTFFTQKLPFPVFKLDTFRPGQQEMLIDYINKNFGEHNAVMAGLNYCTGDAAVIMDDDFQNPASEVAELMQELSKGYDVVFSYYSEKKHSYLRNLGSRFTNYIAGFMVGKPGDLYLSSFKALNRFVIDEVIKYSGPYPYIDGLILRVTENYGRVLVDHHPSSRPGKSGYTLGKLVSLWMNMFMNFSMVHKVEMMLLEIQVLLLWVLL